MPSFVDPQGAQKPQEYFEQQFHLQMKKDQRLLDITRQE
jgi:hypothetical protein